VIRPALASLVCVLVAGACTGGAPVAPTPQPSRSPAESPTPAPTTSPGPASLVIEVDNEPGLIGPTATLAALPTVAVFEDGRIIQPGPVPEIYPGPLVAPLNVRDVGANGVTAIRAAIHAAGLDAESTEPPGPGLPDAGAVVFTVVLDGREVVNRFAGPFGGQPGPGGPRGGSDGRQAAARDLLGRLTDPSETWGGAAGVRETSYDPPGFRVFVVPGAPADQSLPQAPVAWPLTPLASFGQAVTPDRGIDGLRAADVTGTDADLLRPVLRSANALTPFTSDGRTYTLYVRPLLPDEVG
jgi:hypothetical protein